MDAQTVTHLESRGIWDPSGLPPRQGAYVSTQTDSAISTSLCSDAIKKAIALLTNFNLSHAHSPSAWQHLVLDCYFFKSKVFTEGKVVQYPHSKKKTKERKGKTHLHSDFKGSYWKITPDNLYP